MPTPKLTIKVRPEYLSERSNAEAGEFVFACHVTISNTGTVAAQVIGRIWNINHVSGLHEKVRGLGVVGYQPLTSPAHRLNTARAACCLRLRAPCMARIIEPERQQIHGKIAPTLP